MYSFIVSMTGSFDGVNSGPGQINCVYSQMYVLAAGRKSTGIGTGTFPFLGD